MVSEINMMYKNYHIKQYRRETT